MEVASNKSGMHQEFWQTLEILVSREWKRTEKDVMEDVQDWVEKVIARTKKSEDNDTNVNLVVPKRKAENASSSGYGSQEETSKDDLFKKLPDIVCKFSHPYVRSRLEKLMGSNVVNLTDRDYMQRLQERIIEEYGNEMNKRITAREEKEVQRVKNLVLNGYIPIEKAPSIMDNHPVKLIELYCQKLIAERRAKMKFPKIKSRRYPDDTPDPPSGLSIEYGHMYREVLPKICHSPDKYIEATVKDEVNCGHMFDEAEFQLIFYESPAILELQECETVEEMYKLADEIIGSLAFYSDLEGAASAIAE